MKKAMLSQPMDRFQKALDLIRNRTSALKENYKIVDRDTANRELEEIVLALSVATVILQDLVDSNRTETTKNNILSQNINTQTNKKKDDKSAEDLPQSPYESEIETDAYQPNLWK